MGISLWWWHCRSHLWQKSQRHSILPQNTLLSGIHREPMLQCQCHGTPCHGIYLPRSGRVVIWQKYKISLIKFQKDHLQVSEGWQLAIPAGAFDEIGMANSASTDLIKDWTNRGVKSPLKSTEESSARFFCQIIALGSTLVRLGDRLLAKNVFSTPIKYLYFNTGILLVRKQQTHWSEPMINISCVNVGVHMIHASTVLSLYTSATLSGWMKVVLFAARFHFVLQASQLLESDSTM